MAPSEVKEQSGATVAAWIPRALADEIRSRAEAERRSVSAVVRFALEDALRVDTSPMIDPERTSSQ